VPTDGINAAAKTAGDLALSLLMGIGQEIWPHPVDEEKGVVG
jgi:hypothetical protein